jgi:hypothetical protein
MSELMSSSDIENVLSSIRRLVTEDLRPRSAAATPESAAEADTGSAARVQGHTSAGRLLLTPALRVVQPAPQRADTPAQRPPIDGVLSLIGARVSPPPSGFEAETGDAFDAAAEAGSPRSVAAVSVAQPLATAGSDKAKAAASPGPDSAPEPASAPRQQTTAASAEDDGDEADVAAPVVDLDEGILRELIRDVLREELQGPMGERITRNIRKLVRAEMARAVTLRNVD